MSGLFSRLLKGGYVQYTDRLAFHARNRSLVPCSRALDLNRSEPVVPPWASSVRGPARASGPAIPGHADLLEGHATAVCGRLHRLHDNKRFVQVYDHVDHYVPMLTRMYERRLKGYAAIGCAIEQEPLLHARSDGHSSIKVTCDGEGARQIRSGC
jgi:hypothetical protein